MCSSDLGRAGTVTAAVARGPRPASAVPAARPLPVVQRARLSGTPAPLTPALRKQLQPPNAKCDGEVGDFPYERFALAPGKTLMLAPCWTAAYNAGVRAVIVENGGYRDAPFDDSTQTNESLTNAAFDPETATLSAFHKGRGLGDCGVSNSWVWDGARFRMVEARAMEPCRGSINWLATYRARVVGP